MIQKNKFGLIESYILKVINFLIFRDFSQIFLNLFKLIFYFRKSKMVFISRSDVAKHRHVTTYVRAHVCACARVCARLSN